jgi:AcrR family transcriptional regulator
MQICSLCYFWHMTGLRERKKEQTRDAIVAAALKLFDKHGYEQTTIAGIAAAADISPRTFFSYFPSKEHVLFADFDADHEAFVAYLAARPKGENALDAMRSWIVERFAGEDEAGLHTEKERRRCTIEANEELAAHERALMARFEATLAEAIAEDIDAKPDDLQPKLIAAGAVAALRSLEHTEPADPDADPLELLDQALIFVKGGMAALQRKR